MKPLIIYTEKENENEKVIRFTEQELNKVIEDVYNAGFADGCSSALYNNSKPLNVGNKESWNLGENYRIS